MTDEPLSPDAVAALVAALLAFDLPDACRPGVADNLALLAMHARRIAGDPPA